MKYAYGMFQDLVQELAVPGIKILEIGGGARPALKDRSRVEYAVVDPDAQELSKCPADVLQLKGTVQSLPSNEKYDLIISKMVLEHVEDPDSFHQHSLALLKKEGTVLHFFACKNSLPAIANRILPEWLAAKVLRAIGNRNLTEQPKYEAFYRNVGGPSQRQIDYFSAFGYEVLRYNGFVGHRYFRDIIVLASLERIYTNMLYKLKAKSLCTAAIVLLGNKKR